MLFEDIMIMNDEEILNNRNRLKEKKEKCQLNIMHDAYYILNQKWKKIGGKWEKFESILWIG
jgi:hypothetical protein